MLNDNMQDAAIKRTFVFKGNSYTMGRLVLAVIKDYAATHKDTTLPELRETFPDFLLAEGGLHLVEDKAKITPNLEGRYFLKPDELILVLGATIVVCRRWHRFNIYNFLPHASALGYDIAELHDGVPVNKGKSAPKQMAATGSPDKAEPTKATSKAETTAKKSPAQKEKIANPKESAKKEAADRKSVV